MLIPAILPKFEDPILEFIGRGPSSPEPLLGYPGMYQIHHFNFSTCVEVAIGRKLSFEEEYFDEPPIINYGVCDSPAQWLNHDEGGRPVQESEHSFVAGFTRILRSEQSPDGGWRWHKWGPYIGDHEPEYEYLYDEKIEEVWVFRVIRLPRGVTVRVSLAIFDLPPQD